MTRDEEARTLRASQLLGRPLHHGNTTEWGSTDGGCGASESYPYATRRRTANDLSPLHKIDRNGVCVAECPPSYIYIYITFYYYIFTHTHICVCIGITTIVVTYTIYIYFFFVCYIL